MHYNRNYFAQSLRQKASRTVAIIANDLDIQTYGEMISSISGSLAAQGYTTLISDSQYSEEFERSGIQNVLSRMPVPVAGGRRMRPVMRDYRLYVNAIRGIVEQMGDAGLDSRMQVTIGRHVAEVRITIPVFSGKAK